MEVKIRPMIMTDIHNVLEIDKSSFPNPWPVHSYEYEILKNENSRPWVAEVSNAGNKQICGMAVIWNIVGEAHIGTIAIHPDFRETGLGKILLTSILLSAIDEGLESGYLEVRESNVAAINLYKMIGFNFDGVRKKYYRDNQENAILMSIKLNDRKQLERINEQGLRKWNSN